MLINLYDTGFERPYKTSKVSKPIVLAPGEENALRKMYGNLIFDQPAGLALHPFYQPQPGDIASIETTDSTPLSPEERTEFEQLFGTRFIEQFLD